jgi:putative N6-adenine-specific DNA methylase
LPKPFGFEEILAKELLQLGAQDVEQGVRMVSFKGDKGLCTKPTYRCARH